MRIRLSWVGALGVLIAGPRVAGAANPLCSSLPDPIVVTGSSAVGPFIQEMGKVLAGQATPTTLIYQSQGSCTGVNAIVASAPITGTATYYDATGTALSCDLDPAPAGTKVDVGMSDVFVDSCTGQPVPAGVGQFSGPVEAMLFVAPKAAQQQAITAEEAFFAFGYGAPGMAKPWTVETNLMRRNALSGTQGILAREIAVPPGRWKGLDKSNSQGVLDAVVGSTSPESTIGILGSDFYDAHRDVLKSLAFQAFHQNGAYFADSTATSFDKRNVRDGHYVNFGYLHLIAKVDAQGVPSTPAAKRFVDWVTGNTDASTGTPAPFVIFDITIKAKLIPTCAMKVQRASEGGVIAPFKPATDCGAQFETAVASH